MHHLSRCQTGRMHNMSLVLCVMSSLNCLRFFHFYGSSSDLIFPKLSTEFFPSSFSFFFSITWFLPHLPTLQMWRTWFRVESQSEIRSARARHERSFLGRLARNRVRTERNSYYRPKSQHCARNIYRTCIGNPGIAKLCNADLLETVPTFWQRSSGYSDI